MGGHYLSVHFKTEDTAIIRAAAEREAARSGAKFLIAQPAEGWIRVYPSVELLDPEPMERFAAEPKAVHTLAFMVHDSDILCYWYFRDGQLVDYYHSAPDYFGEATERDLAAVGNAEAFGDLLTPAKREAFAAVIRPRMIDGEFVDEDEEEPVFEEERLTELAELLGITGAMGSYDSLKDGEPTDAGATAEEMEEEG
jgi:hypothetical protein